MTTSKHYITDRAKREALIQTIGEGKEIARFTVDKHHKNGPEIHIITDTGIIIIKNKRTKKLITKLIARPAQIRRYYEEVPAELAKVLELAREHQTKKYCFA